MSCKDSVEARSIDRYRQLCAAFCRHGNKIPIPIAASNILLHRVGPDWTAPSELRPLGIAERVRRIIWRKVRACGSGLG